MGEIGGPLLKYCENRHKCNHCERTLKVEIIVVIANEY